MKKAVGIVLGCLLLAGAFFLGRLVGAGELGAPDGGESGQQNLRLSFTPSKTPYNVEVSYDKDDGTMRLAWTIRNISQVDELSLDKATVLGELVCGRGQGAERLRGLRGA